MCNNLVHFSVMSGTKYKYKGTHAHHFDDADIITKLYPAKPKYIRNKNIPVEGTRNLESDAVYRSASNFR